MKTTKNIFILILAFAMAISFPSCKKENLCDCFKTTGPNASETRNVEAFDSLFVEDNIEVRFTEAPYYEVTVEAGHNIVPLIKTKVENRYLKISNSNKCNFVRSYKRRIIVHVKSPKIRSLYNYGNKNIVSENTITSDTIDYYIKGAGDIHLKISNTKTSGHIHGNGDIYLSGNCYEHTVHATGQTFINAENLSTYYTWVFYKSTGIANIKADGKIVALMYGSGNVFYDGNPPIIEVTRWAEGQLIKK
jgi:hypothetical protein